MKKVKLVFEAYRDALISNDVNKYPAYTLEVRNFSSDYPFSSRQDAPVLFSSLPIPVISSINKSLSGLSFFVVAPVQILINGALPLVSYKFLQLS